MCETPKSPPGDYNQVNPRIDRRNVARPCETPKSPPGDYNRRIRRSRNCPRRLRVKHLKPRQGITTRGIAVPDRRGPVQACETPKSPPGDYNYSSTSRNAASMIRKCETPKSPPGDYNRIQPAPARRAYTSDWCETPKSPPGDYKPVRRARSSGDRRISSVKHLNPRQGITNSGQYRIDSRASTRCETPKSPPGDYNTSSSCPPFRRPVIVCVKHLNPRQGITTIPIPKIR